MVNLQDFIGNSQFFKKFKVDDLLFAEFLCPADSADTKAWWLNNYFAFVLAGEMVLKTPSREYILKGDDCVFAKKGSVITHQDIHEDFCELLVFVPDDFIKSVFQKHQIPLVRGTTENIADTVIPLAPDNLLVNYFHSLLGYFSLATPPSSALLRLKFEELLVSILLNNGQMPLKYYFTELFTSSKPSVKGIMEANFFSNLSLNEFAGLCSRSLSAFKRDFFQIYRKTPGKWLQEKRLDYSRYLMKATDYSIDQICTVSGFENISHFIRVFKNKYGLTPGKFHMEQKTSLLKEINLNSSV